MLKKLLLGIFIITLAGPSHGAEESLHKRYMALMEGRKPGNTSCEVVQHLGIQLETFRIAEPYAPQVELQSNAPQSIKDAVSKGVLDIPTIQLIHKSTRNAGDNLLATTTRLKEAYPKVPDTALMEIATRGKSIEDIFLLRSNVKGLEQLVNDALCTKQNGKNLADIFLQEVPYLDAEENEGKTLNLIEVMSAQCVLYGQGNPFNYIPNETSPVLFECVTWVDHKPITVTTYGLLATLFKTADKMSRTHTQPIFLENYRAFSEAFNKIEEKNRKLAELKEREEAGMKQLAEIQKELGIIQGEIEKTSHIFPEVSLS